MDLGDEVSCGVRLAVTVKKVIFGRPGISKSVTPRRIFLYAKFQLFFSFKMRREKVLTVTEC